MFERQKDIINEIIARTQQGGAVLEESAGAINDHPLTQNLKKILTSSSAQLEFLTLMGIIVNGVMQGYATSNTIYVFLIENLEDKIYASCGMTPPSKSEKNNPGSEKMF